MATFYGSVQGGRGKATRLGTSNSGLKTTTQSYSGSVVVYFFVDADDTEHCRISFSKGSSESGDYTLYHGPIKGLHADQVNLTK